MTGSYLFGTSFFPKNDKKLFFARCKERKQFLRSFAGDHLVIPIKTQPAQSNLVLGGSITLLVLLSSHRNFKPCFLELFFSEL